MKFALLLAVALILALTAIAVSSARPTQPVAASWGTVAPVTQASWGT